MSDAILLCLAGFAAVVGMGWLALSQDVHWRQVTGARTPRSRSTTNGLRLMGALQLALSLVFCLMADNASMAALVWVMLLGGSAVLVAMVLSWRAQALTFLLSRGFVWLRKPNR